MGSTVSYTSFDYAPVTPVPVIASFDSKGKIHPLYVRIDGVRYRVMEYWVKCQFRNLIEFNCQISSGDNFVYPLLLTYHQAEAVWSIPGVDRSPVRGTGGDSV